MSAWIKRLWCQWTHGGGTIERDDMGRINWRCAKCGRWSDKPVPLEDEAKFLSRRTSDDAR